MATTALNDYSDKPQELVLPSLVWVPNPRPAPLALLAPRQPVLKARRRVARLLGNQLERLVPATQAKHHLPEQKCPALRLARLGSNPL